MKRVIVVLILFFLIWAPFQAYASDGLIKPHSRFYFLQTWGESIRLFFTRSPEQKLVYLLDLTDRRINEMVDNPSDAVANRYGDHYQQLGELTNKIQNQNDATNKIREISLIQQQVLSEVYPKVPQSAQNAIINAQENSSKHVAKTIETIEGPKKAQEYIEQVAQIQQVEKMERLEQVEQAPAENGPNSDPSQNIPRDLKGVNPLREGQPLNPLNPAQDTQDDEKRARMEPVQPIEMNQPAGQI